MVVFAFYTFCPIRIRTLRFATQSRLFMNEEKCKRINKWVWKQAYKYGEIHCIK